MPLYEYQCADCGKVLEAIQKFSDEPLSECPDCGGSLERLLSAPAIQFKGSGWYITDYARKAGNGEKAADKPKAKTDSKSESNAESRPSKSDSASGSAGEKST